MQYLDSRLVELHYLMPLNEIIYDFFDTLKAHAPGEAGVRGGVDAAHLMHVRVGDAGTEELYPACLLYTSRCV